MIALLNWRIWVLVGLLALGPILYMKGRQDGKRAIRMEWASATAAANLESFKRTERLQGNVDAAQKSAVTRAAGNRAAAARAGDALERLRSAISARKLAEESRDSAVKRADTAEQLLIEGGSLLRESAESCDRIVNDRQLLIDAWPK